MSYVPEVGRAKAASRKRHAAEMTLMLDKMPHAKNRYAYIFMISADEGIDSVWSYV